MKSLALGLALVVLPTQILMAPANADDFDAKFDKAENELRKLMCDFKKVSDSPSATVKEQTKASYRIRHGGKEIEKKYGGEIAKAAATSIASEGRNLLCPDDDVNAKLLEGVTRILCDYHRELNQLRELDSYSDRPDADEYRQEVAGKFLPHQLKPLAKVFGRERVGEVLSDFENAGTDRASAGPLDCG